MTNEASQVRFPSLCSTKPHWTKNHLSPERYLLNLWKEGVYIFLSRLILFPEGDASFLLAKYRRTNKYRRFYSCIQILLLLTELRSDICGWNKHAVLMWRVSLLSCWLCQ